MRHYNDVNQRRRRVQEKAIYGGLFESIFYETKPFLMLGIAAIAANNHYASAGFGRACVGILFAAASYIIYRRLVHRGYLK